MNQKPDLNAFRAKPPLKDNLSNQEERKQDSGDSESQSQNQEKEHEAFDEMINRKTEITRSVAKSKHLQDDAMKEKLKARKKKQEIIELPSSNNETLEEEWTAQQQQEHE